MKCRFLILLLGLVLVTACKPDLHFVPESFEPASAEISGDEDVVSLVFSSEAGSALLAIRSNKSWTASFVNERPEKWCSISSEGGPKGTFTLNVAVKANETYDERVAVILLRCEDVQRTIVVTQKQLDALLLSPGRVELPQEGGHFTIEVNTNVSFTISFPGESLPWLRMVETKGLIPNKFTIVADPNTDLNPRQAVLTVSSSLDDEKVTVYQAGESPALVISAREVEVPTVGGDFEVLVTSNLDVEMEMLPASCDWVEEIKTKMISTNSYFYAVASNETGEEREMSLVFKNAEHMLSDTLHVKQAFLPGFSYSTSRQEVKSPWLPEPGEGVRIFWGDGSYESYAPDLTHRYAEPGSHTVVVEGDPVAPVRISELEDGMVIDFSRIKKKEEAK